MDEIKNIILNATLEEGALPEQITYLTTSERIIFIAIFSGLFLISFCGNIAAIFVTIRRKHRFIQKCSIISLALSDLCMSIAYSTNNLETFSHPMINWVLGEFACSFIPMAQIFGLMVNLFSMVVIALDRYRNVVKALAHRWNPKPWTCILGFVFIWVLCLGISYSIFPMFEIKLLRVYYAYPESVYEIFSFCISPVKNELKIYYICIATLIFSTLWSCFLWLNYSIARLVWAHRKPIHHNSNKYENSLSIETSTTQIRESEAQANDLPPNANTNTNDHMINSNKYMVHKRNLHVERKIRTFKIIVFSMLVFTLCRLPFWIFNVLKLSEMYNERMHWVMIYWFNALALLNCAVNPFLYSFLHPTLNVICKLRQFLVEFVKKICCWSCTATEFDEFGKENPFCPAHANAQRHVKEHKGERIGNVVTGKSVDIGDYPIGRSYNLQRY